MFSVFRKHAATGTALMFTSGTSYGEAVGDLEGEPLIMRAWISRSIADSLKIRASLW